MKKVELLAPAGNMDALKAAVQNGADAVFLGGRMFGARASATNFDMLQMKEAVEYAHLYGVKIHVTVNTLIKDEELEECLNYIGELYKLNVDALIVQDLGLMHAIQKRYPNFEIHASTQMHIHNVAGLRQLKEWGITRAVVARETPLELVKEMCKEDIEVEIFVYGAYCVSYSGQCLMSSSIGGRSGNRGECAQTCRLPYELYKEEKDGLRKIATNGDYLLSPKDLNTLEAIPQLIESGAASFKIEGRMKRPEYVALVTSLYRQAIDAYYAHEKFEVNKAMIEAMQKVFNRGFTLGHLFHKKGSELMSIIRPNHVGIEIGTVTGFTKDKMTVKLHHELNQGDGVRILGKQEDNGFIVNYIYKNGLLVNKGNAGDVIELEKMKFVDKNAKVLKTSDVNQLEALAKTIDSNQRKISVNGKIILNENYPLQFTVTDSEGFSVAKEGEIVEKAMKTPLAKERILSQLNKTGNTPFSFEKIEVIMDEGIIYPISKLNEIRRAALEELALIRATRQRTLLPSLKEETVRVEKAEVSAHVSVTTYDQYQAAKAVGIDKIDIIGNKLYQQIKVEDNSVGYVYPRVMKHEYTHETGVIGEVGALQIKGLTAAPSLNCFNHKTATLLFRNGCDKVSFSLETSLNQMAMMMENFREFNGCEGNFERVVYGRVENMISEACVVNMNLSDNGKKNCALCKNGRYYLKDYKQKYYPLLGDDDCMMHVYHSEVRDEIASISEMKEMGVNSFRCVLTFETREESERILRRMMDEVYKCLK